jgi:hypothetical protein
MRRPARTTRSRRPDLGETHSAGRTWVDGVLSIATNSAIGVWEDRPVRLGTMAQRSGLTWLGALSVFATVISVASGSPFRRSGLSSAVRLASTFHSLPAY